MNEKEERKNFTTSCNLYFPRIRDLTPLLHASLLLVKKMKSSSGFISLLLFCCNDYHHERERLRREIT
jgi:hypothetical protein